MSTVATNRNHEFKRHSEHLDQQHINSRTALTTTKHKQVPLKIGHLEQGCFDVQTPRQMACKLTISTKHTTIDPFWNHREKPKQNIDGGWREAWSKLPERLTSYGTPPHDRFWDRQLQNARQMVAGFESNNKHRIEKRALPKRGRELKRTCISLGSDEMKHNRSTKKWVA